MSSLAAFDPDREELVPLQGDPNDVHASDVYQQAQQLDPSGSGRLGMASQMNLQKTALGHPLIRYRDVVIEADVYADGAGGLIVNIYCPRCRHSLSIPSTRKAIEFEPQATLDKATGQIQKRGKISVEPFRCTWELGRGTDATAGDRMNFGVGLCNWTVAIDNNVARDA
jgi:hypothetical protein